MPWLGRLERFAQFGRGPHPRGAGADAGACGGQGSQVNVVVVQAGEDSGALGVEDGLAGRRAEAGRDFGHAVSDDAYVDRPVAGGRPRPGVADQHGGDGAGDAGRDASQARTAALSAPSSGAAPEAAGRRGGSTSRVRPSAGQVTVPSGVTSWGP